MNTMEKTASAMTFSGQTISAGHWYRSQLCNPLLKVSSESDDKLHSRTKVLTFSRSSFLTTAALLTLMTRFGAAWWLARTLKARVEEFAGMFSYVAAGLFGNSQNALSSGHTAEILGNFRANLLGKGPGPCTWNPLGGLVFTIVPRHTPLPGT